MKQEAVKSSSTMVVQAVAFIVWSLSEKGPVIIVRCKTGVATTVNSLKFLPFFQGELSATINHSARWPIFTSPIF
jgi:hypothetical protein